MKVILEGFKKKQTTVEFPTNGKGKVSHQYLWIGNKDEAFATISDKKELRKLKKMIELALNYDSSKEKFEHDLPQR